MERGRGSARRRIACIAVGVCALVAAIAGVASAAARDFEHPANHTPPTPSSSSACPPTDPQRADTPNDPGYDIAEPDDPDSKLNGGPFDASTNLYDEEFGFFGFPSVRTRATALYTAGPNLATCTAKLVVPCPQISGFNASGAWKLDRGRPDVVVAVLDTGIKWDRGALRTQVHLNKGELPVPKRADGSNCASYDCNGDGAFNVTDYANDPRVNPGGGPHGTAGQVDAEDLIAAFSDGTDARLERVRRRHRGLGLLRQRQRPLRRLELLRRVEPRVGPDERGRRARQRRRWRHRCLPALPAHADPHLGHLRLRRQRLRDGDALRHRQRRVGHRGRQRLHLPLGLRRAGVPVRLRPRGRADLLRRRPQHRQPQLRRQLRPRDADRGDRARHHGPRPGRRQPGRAGARGDLPGPAGAGWAARAPPSPPSPTSAAPTPISTAARARSRWRARRARRTPARPPAPRGSW